MNAVLQSVRAELDKYKKLEDQLKQQIQEAMGEASKAQFETGSVTWQRSKDSTVLDTKRLLADHPELLTQYSLTRSGGRRFLVQAKTINSRLLAKYKPKTVGYLTR